MRCSELGASLPYAGTKEEFFKLANNLHTYYENFSGIYLIQNDEFKEALND